MISSKSTLAGMLAISAIGMFAMPLTADAVTICRGPGFYQTHSGEEKEDTANVLQEIIVAVDGFDVCGEHITETSNIGGLDSALEGLCVRTQGVDERQLYRQALTTKANCLVSEGVDCDAITDPFINVNFSDCDALCAGNPVMDGPTVEQCILELGCFNKGGRMIDGACSIGTCNDDGVTECGSDDDCGVDIDCVRYADSCKLTQFCSDELDAEAKVCPKKGPASSPMICRQARKNGCTIDDVQCHEACVHVDPCTAACEATPGCDPLTACTDYIPCIESCLSIPFGDGSPCGCESTWAFFCDQTTANDLDFIDCFLSYGVAEDNGFCTQCEDDVFSCLP